MEILQDVHPVDHPTLTEYILPGEGFQALPLVRNLCDQLIGEHIAYCHWKSNNALDRSAAGANDLDLLVKRSDAPRFAEILQRLSFKQAKASKDKQMPGVQDYYGYDERGERLVHVHVHYQLIIGHDLSKNVRMPLEAAYLDSASQDHLFRVPAPEFEFIVFVIRMILKHAAWEAVLLGEGSLGKAERRELEHLEGLVDRGRVHGILRQHLPYLEIELFERCCEAIQPGVSIWTGLKAGQRLRAQLGAQARRPWLADAYLKFERRVRAILRQRIQGSTAKHQLETGGAVIALVGGDGAGKSTAVQGLYRWLARDFDVIKAHLGKPTWSLTTRLVRGLLKVGQLIGLYPLEASFQETLKQKSLLSPGYPFILREVCRARDRYLTYRKARRFAANGGLVIFDRFPLQQIQLMDGPQIRRFIGQLADQPEGHGFLKPRAGSRLVAFLLRVEEGYYRQFVSPEALIVLQLDPEIAAQRKTEEQPALVRARAAEIMRADWQSTHAYIVDSRQSQTEVMAELKALIWPEL